MADIDDATILLVLVFDSLGYIYFLLLLLLLVLLVVLVLIYDDDTGY